MRYSNFRYWNFLQCRWLPWWRFYYWCAWVRRFSDVDKSYVSWLSWIRWQLKRLVGFIWWDWYKGTSSVTHLFATRAKLHTNAVWIELCVPALAITRGTVWGTNQLEDLLIWVMTWKMYKTSDKGHGVCCNITCLKRKTATENKL